MDDSPTPTLATPPGLFFAVRPEIKGLYDKLAKIMGRLQPVDKTGHNNFFNYNYVEQDAVYRQVQAAMADLGVALVVTMGQIQDIEYKTGEGDRAKVKNKTRVTFYMTLADSDSGASVTTAWTSEAQDTEDKGLTKASAQAAKYFLLRTFLMGTGDPDPDGGGPGGQTQGQGVPGGRPAGQPRTQSQPKTQQTPPPPPAQAPAGNGSRPAVPAQAPAGQSPYTPEQAKALAGLAPALVAKAPKAKNDYATLYIEAAALFKAGKNDIANAIKQANNDAIQAYLDLADFYQAQAQDPTDNPAPF